MKLNYNNKIKNWFFALSIVMLFSIKATLGFLPDCVTQAYDNKIKNSFMVQYALHSFINLKSWYIGTDQLQRQEPLLESYSLAFFKGLSWFRPFSFSPVNHKRKNINHNARFAFNCPTPFGCHSAICLEPHQIAIDQQHSDAQRVDDFKGTDSSNDISAKVASLFNCLKECSDCFKSISEESKILPIHEDESYRDAKGHLVKILRNYIKTVKMNLNIADRLLQDSYSKSSGGNGYFITVGKDSKNSNGLFRGFRDELDSDLQTCFNAKLKGAIQYYKDVENRLEGNYKVHLMPKSFKQYLILIKEIIILAQENSEFRDSLAFFKLYTDINFDRPEDEIIKQLQEHSCDGTVPIIVLYPATGKEHAQKILDIVYEKFGTLKGLNYAPCYNEKVTSLIFITQQNRDKKECFKEWFNYPRVYFNEIFNGTPSYRYRLINPRLETLLQKYIQGLKNNHSNSRIIHLIEKIQRKSFSLFCADKLGFSLLDYAYKYQNTETIDVLNAHKAARSKISPIGYLEKYNNNGLRLLLKESCDWNSVDNDSNSLFYYALKYGNAEAMSLLSASSDAHTA